MSLISKGQTLISNIELGSLKQEVPFEIHSDYTGKSTLTDSRQFRLNVKPSENTLSNTYVNMGIDNQYGNSFYISCPVTDATISGDKVFIIDNSKKTTIPNSSNITSLNTISVQNSYIHDIYVPEYAKNEIISVNGTLLLQNNVFAPTTWETISNIASGLSHTLILTPTGNVYSTGSNEFGQLGIDNENLNLNVFTRLLNPNPEPGREGEYLSNVKLIGCVGHSSYYTTLENEFYAFGRNKNKELGLGSSSAGTYTTPQSVSTNFTSNIIQIASNYGNIDFYPRGTSILTEDGQVYFAGSNSKYRGGMPEQYGTYTTFTAAPSPADANVKKVIGGLQNTMIIKNDGTVYGCGVTTGYELGVNSPSYTGYMQLGLSPQPGTIIPFTNVKSGYFHERCTHVLLENGSLYGTGRNYGGVLGTGYSNIQTGFTAIPGNGSSDVVDISGGEYFSCLKKSDNTIYFSGQNVGDSGSSSVFNLYSYISDVDKISCGPFSISILNNNGQVLGMGQNTNGNLGVGNFINSGTFKYYNLINNPDLVSFMHKTNGDYNSLYNFNGLYSNLSIKCYDYISEVFINQQYGARITSGGRMFASSFIPFTGVHMSNNRKKIESGLIVSIIPSNLNKSFQDIKLSNTQMDCNVIGVMSGSDTFNSLGEGGIWVSDINGTISSGDYITSSILHGYGQKQDSDFMENYTVAKIIQNCYFDEHENLRYLSLSDDYLTLNIIPKEEYVLNPDKYFRAQFVGCTYHCG